MDSNQFSRLPRCCIPLHYAIEIMPCLVTSTYVGKQSIFVRIDTYTSEIVLNAKGLTITFATFDEFPVRLVHNIDEDRIHFPLSKQYQSGEYRLYVEFTGEISDKMKGFYQSKYTTSGGVEKVMLVTHFEVCLVADSSNHSQPTNARLVFPCWDEPNFKATFSIRFTVSSHLTVISNMPVHSRVELEGGCVTYVFENTPKMSTYLVAFAVGEFEYIEAKDSNGILVRVYSRCDMLSETRRGELALDVTCRALPFFGNYFRTSYPLPKVDLLAVPDFAGGAMENWGLITFRERTLLVEPQTASPSSIQLVALVVSHELAHMWFGNLVTMDWWTDLWLKEGFANWIEYLCVDHCFPSWEIWKQFTYDQMASTLRLDALRNSHPIEVTVTHPDEIEEIFDTISYCKGASLIHMLHAYLGDDVFRDGVCAYLNRHAFGNAETADLWDAFRSASGIDVANLMREWTQKAGFPVLMVAPLSIENGFVNVRLSQMQYRLPSSEYHNESQLWSIPIEFTCYSLKEYSVSVCNRLLEISENTVKVPVSGSSTCTSDYIIQVNAKATGLYHVCYSDDQFVQFIKYFHSLSWTIPGKMAFLNDAFALAKSGAIPINKWFKCLPMLQTFDNSYTLWRCVLLDGFSNYVQRLVHGGDIPLESYHMFLRGLIRPAINRIYVDPSSETIQSHEMRLVYSLLLLTAGAEAGALELIDHAKSLYEFYRSQDVVFGALKLPGHVRLAVLSIMVRHGDPEILNYLMNIYPLIASPDEQSSVLSAICSAKEGPALDCALSFCLDSQGPVRDQDRVQGLLTCAKWSSAARFATWTAVKSNWDWLNYIYHGQFLLPRLLEGVLSGFSSQDHVNDARNFLNTHPVSCPRTVKQIFELLDSNRLLLIRDEAAIAQALEECNDIFLLPHVPTPPLQSSTPEN